MHTISLMQVFQKLPDQETACRYFEGQRWIQRFCKRHTIERLNDLVARMIGKHLTYVSLVA